VVVADCAACPDIVCVSDEPDILGKLNAALAGRYELTRELGRGGMATVYLATDVKHDREVAIKVLLPELSATIGGDRFEREIRLAAKLQHPHILGMFDSGAADGLLYYVMPFVKGESLRDRIDREGMLPIEDALQITLEVNDALGHAHSQGVVHRDIKPENILLSNGHALLADFGIARAIQEGNSQKLTQTGMSLGTAHYMAPEQASGEVAGPAADLYSLGCVLYEMLSGEPPFQGKNAMQIMARHAMEQVPSIRIVRAVVPEDIEQAIFVTLNKTPADRPQNAEQFAQLLGVPMGNTTSMRAFTATMARRTPTMSYAAIPQPPAPTAWYKRPAILVAALLVMGAGFGAWRFTSGGRGPIGALGPEARRLAVLYFKDLSKDSSLGPVADGLTEGLTHSLSTASSFTVISQSGVEKFRGTDVAPDSIARALRVGYLVRGEVEHDGDKISVSVRLDDASGVNLKRASFLGPQGKLLALRDSLVIVASDLIRQQLGAELQVKDDRAGTGSSDAWLLLQRGIQAQKAGDARNAAGDAAGLEQQFHAADSLFAAAEQVDPKWSEPATRAAILAYRRARLAGGDAVAIRKWVDIGMAHANRALGIDPNAADALEVRGNLRYFPLVQSLETDDARRKEALTLARADLEKATTINSRQAGAYATLSHLYYQIPSLTPSDVYIAAQRALEADEFLASANLILSRLFFASYDLGQFDKAQQWCEQARTRFPRDVRAVRCQLYMLTTKTATPNPAEAWRLADSAVALVPPGARTLERPVEDMLVAAVIARASQQQPNLADSARRVAKRSEGTPEIDPTRDLALRGAFVYTLLGDKDDAIRLLKQYLAVNPGKAEGLRDDAGWWFRSLEGDPRFRQAVGSKQ